MKKKRKEIIEKFNREKRNLKKNRNNNLCVSVKIRGENSKGDI